MESSPDKGSAISRDGSFSGPLMLPVHFELLLFLESSPSQIDAPNSALPKRRFLSTAPRHPLQLGGIPRRGVVLEAHMETQAERVSTGGLPMFPRIQQVISV